MTITTLLAYWSDQKNQADKELSDARVALTKAQNELATLRDSLTKANQALADLVAQTKKIRADLAEAATPADVDALESELAKAINDTRTKQAEIIGIEANVDTAQTALNLANAKVTAATSRVSLVAAALQADDQDKDRVKVGAGQAVRAANLVKISGLTNHPFIVNDVITVMGMTDTGFNGTFTINAVTDTSITYPPTVVAVGSGQALRASNSVTISGLIGHPFNKNDVIIIMGMKDAGFNGTFTIDAITDNTIAYSQTLADAKSGGGVISLIQVAVGSGKAVRASDSVTISGLTGRLFNVDDMITVINMTDVSFNGTFTITEVNDKAIIYPQTQADATTGDGAISVIQAVVGDEKAVRASNVITISDLTGHSFNKNDVIAVTGMTDVSFDGTFTISNVNDNAITYPQIGTDTKSGGGVIKVIQVADATSGGGVVFGKRALRLRHKLTTPPLSTTVADATTALAAKPWTDAKARIEADLPQELRDCANERAKVELAVLDNDKSKIVEIDKLLGVAIDKTENLREVLKNADADFRDYVANAKRRFDQAVVIATRLADLKQNPLTVAENASIHSKKPDGTLDTALQTKRNDAAKKRMEIAAAQIDVDAKKTDVDIAILNAQAADIDKDPNTDPAVVTATGLLTTAKGTLAGAITAFTSDMQADLIDWETAVPDTAWRNFADFNDAKRLLIALKTDPAPLVTAMDKAETDLVVALQEADKNRKTLDLLKTEALTTAAKTDFDTGILPRRVFSALRGDS